MTPAVEAECCGQHNVCEGRQLHAVEDIEYYDDEELDAYRGRSALDYNEMEIGEFRYVLYTMRGEEVAGWMRSLQLRGVELPAELKDEALMIIGEALQ